MDCVENNDWVATPAVPAVEFSAYEAVNAYDADKLYILLVSKNADDEI